MITTTTRPGCAEWAHEYLVRPFVEGTERINRAWQGANVHSLSQTPLRLKERIVAFATGIILLIPLVNLIVWVAWQTFGRPEKLSDPYCPEVHPPAPSEPPLAPPPIPIVAPPGPGEPRRPVELFTCKETDLNTRAETQANWRIETYPDMFIVQQDCGEHTSTSIYDRSWMTKEYHRIHRKNGDRFDVVFREPDKLEMYLSIQKKETRKEKQFSEQLPWIQQPTIGFKNFILSSATQLRFYGAAPENRWPLGESPPFILSFLATKTGEENVAGYGKLVKVEVQAEKWPYSTYTSQLWFDPQTGALRKFINPFENKLIEYALTPPPPAPARP